MDDAATISPAGDGAALPAAGAPSTAHTLPAAHEERLNALTHGAGFLLAVPAGLVLIARVQASGNSWQVAACGLYVATLVAAYGASTLSHVFRNPASRALFRTADQALIFLFIAGSWTPIAAAWLRGGAAWWAFHAGLWAVAVGGFLSKALFAHRVSMGTVSTALYLALGWSPVLVAAPLAHTLPTPLCLWLVAGGACYTLGLAFFQYDSRVTYFHATWHVLVVAGSACHYLGILNYCTAAV